MKLVRLIIKNVIRISNEASKGKGATGQALSTDYVQGVKNREIGGPKCPGRVPEEVAVRKS